VRGLHPPPALRERVPLQQFISFRRPPSDTRLFHTRLTSK
jgi:hypothetical protein